MIRQMQEKERFWGIKLIGWGVVTANAVLAAIFFALPHVTTVSLPPKMVEILSIVAIFPRDFLFTYLREVWLVHLTWMILITLGAQGVVLFNRFGRMVFIVLNVVHIVILSYIVLVMKNGQPDFLDYFFKLYFNLVASGTYVGFLTMQEVRVHYQLGPKDERSPLVLKRPRLKQPSAKDAHGFHNLGLAYSQLERYDEAIDALQKSLIINPRNAGCHYDLGLVFFRKKEYDNAVKLLKEAVSIDPILAKAYLQLGITYQKQGCTKEALDAFKKVTHIQPANAQAYKEMGGCYMSLERYEEAMEAFHKAIELNPRDEEVHCQMGMIYLNKFEKYKEARDVLKKSIRLRPAQTQAHYQLGMVSLKLESYKDAIRSFKEVIRLEKDHRYAHYQLGFSYAMVGDFNSAHRECKYLEKADKDLADTLKMVLK